MKSDFLYYTRSRSPELAEYLLAIAETPLEFKGKDPLAHSSYNHIHLWFLEYCSDRFNWIKVDYRVPFVGLFYYLKSLLHLLLHCQTHQIFG